MQAAKAEQHKEAIAEGENFLAENAKRDGVVTTESGLQYEVLTTGEGAKPTPMEGVTPTPVAQPAAPAPPPAATTNMEGVAPLAPTLAPAMD